MNLPRMRRALPQVALALAVVFVYFSTLAPGLSWANRGADGGDLITAAATFGVAHPPGYPTYLALARLFQFFPLRALAFRTNLLSAVAAALAAVAVADLVARCHRGQRRIGQAAGLVAGFGFGLSPLLWSQAVITEVHALHALFIALILRLCPLDGGVKRDGGAWIDRLGGLIFGLGMGNHLTTALLLPVWLLAGTLDRRRVRWMGLLRRLGWLSVGLLIYASLPFRAASGSPVNWGNPASWENFWWLVSGQLYQKRLFNLPLDYVLARIPAMAALLLSQFGLLGLFLGFFGLLFGRPVSPRFFWITGWTIVVFAAFATGYDAYDSYAYLIPAFLAFALWFGLGVAALAEEVSARAGWLAPSAAVAIVLLLFAHAISNLPSVDASQDSRAEVFGRAVLDTAPANAILFVRGDEETFALWYFHFALGERSDLAIVNEPLLDYAWYRHSIRTAHPNLTMPDEPASSWRMTIVAANRRPACDARADSIRPLTCWH
jgi:hypothetical protein